jgi:hypothetical protein
MVSENQCYSWAYITRVLGETLINELVFAFIIAPVFLFIKWLIQDK